MLSMGFGHNILFMFKVYFSENGPMVCIAKDFTIEQALQFALNLHNYSNVSHTIFVGSDVEHLDITLVKQ